MIDGIYADMSEMLLLAAAMHHPDTAQGLAIRAHEASEIPGPWYNRRWLASIDNLRFLGYLATDNGKLLLTARGRELFRASHKFHKDLLHRI